MQEILDMVTKALNDAVQSQEIILLTGLLITITIFLLLVFSTYRIPWQIRVYWRKLCRWGQNIRRGDNRWWRWVRILSMILAGLLSFLILNWVVNKDLWPIDLSNLKLNSEGEITKGAWTLVVAVVSAPVAFVVWWFRDSNQRQLIDNQRKETNLKDFQQLAQWASGLHCEHSESDLQIVNDNDNPMYYSAIVPTNLHKKIAQK